MKVTTGYLWGKSLFLIKLYFSPARAIIGVLDQLKLHSENSKGNHDQKNWQDPERGRVKD